MTKHATSIRARLGHATLGLCLTGLALATAAPIAPVAAEGAAADVPGLVGEIVTACLIGPTQSIKDDLSAKLDGFLKQAIERKSARIATLEEQLAQLPTDTEEAKGQIAAPIPRATFFSIFYKCITDQTRLKLKALDIAIE